MFGRGKKKKEGEVPIAVINPSEFTGAQELPDIPQQVPQQTEQPVSEVQNVQQPVQQIQQPMYQQQVQQPVQQTQNTPQAYISQAAVVEPGIFRYVIEANYPLAIGNCEIRQ